MGQRLVLILGGTSEAAALARVLATDPMWRPLTSLAGRTSAPAQIQGDHRTGGFGGISGLTDWLVHNRPAAVVDATHPFARKMPHHAEAACRAAGIPHLRLIRPPWQPSPEDRWHEVADAADASRLLPDLGEVAFLSTGHQDLACYLSLASRMKLVVRTIELLDGLPLGVIAVRGRPPFSVQAELELFRRLSVDVLVSKASGGSATFAKIEAARQLELPVVMLKRPALPESVRVDDIAGALVWLAGLRS